MRFICFFIVVFFSSLILNAAEQKTVIESKDWGFNGPFGKFDKSALQRGLQVYKEVCSTCHSLKYVAFRNLSALGYNQDEIKSFASDYNVVDGPNDEGEMFERPGRPSDRFVSPYQNDQSARIANGGAYPPDLSLITKARSGGSDYLYSLLIGYSEPPKGMDVKEGLYYNSAYYGNWIAMPQPLYADSVSYSDGHEASIEQMSADVTEFLTWAAEPEMEVRKRTGIATVTFLFILVVLSYFAKIHVWSNLKKNKSA